MASVPKHTSFSSGMEQFYQLQEFIRSIYSLHVNLNWNLFRLSLLIGFAAFGIGCGGLNASQSVSPASFFLPGLGQNDAAPKAPATSTIPAAALKPAQVVAFSTVTR